MPGLLEGALQDAVGAVLSSIADAMVAVCMWVLNLLWNLLSDSTAPDVTGDFIYTWAGRIFYISLPLLAIFLVAQMIYAAVIRSGEPIRRGITGVLIAVIGTIASVPIIATLTRGFDSIADGLAQATLNDLGEGGEALSGALLGVAGDEAQGLTVAFASAIGASGLVGTIAAAFVVMVLMFLMIAGAIAVFVALLLRTVLLYIVIVIGPLMLAGLAFEKTRGWAVKWMSMVVALIFTKLGIVVVFGLGVSMITTLPEAMSSDGELVDGGLSLVGQLFSGATMLAVASLVPVACFKFFDFLGESGVASMHAGAQAGVDEGKGALQKLDPRNAGEWVSSQRGDSGASEPQPQDDHASDPSSATQGQGASSSTSGAGAGAAGTEAGAQGAGTGAAGAGAGTGGAGAGAAGAAAVPVAAVAAAKGTSDAVEDGAQVASEQMDQDLATPATGTNGPGAGLSTTAEQARSSQPEAVADGGEGTDQRPTSNGSPARAAQQPPPEPVGSRASAVGEGR